MKYGGNRVDGTSGLWPKSHGPLLHLVGLFLTSANPERVVGQSSFSELNSIESTEFGEYCFSNFQSY